MKYRFAVWFYYTFRGLHRDFAAAVANRLSPPNVRFGGSLSDVADDLRKMKELHPEWPCWEALDRAHEEYELVRAGDRYVDSYGVSWG